jgi:hypothetical protein
VLSWVLGPGDQYVRTMISSDTKSPTHGHSLSIPFKMMNDEHTWLESPELYEKMEIQSSEVFLVKLRLNHCVDH